MSIRALAMEAVLRRVITSTRVDVPQEVARRTVEGTPRPADVPASVRKRFDTDTMMIDGSSVVTIRQGGSATKSILFLPGGGYANPVMKSHWSVAARFAETSGHDVVVPLYEVAPKGDATRAHAFVDEVLSRELARRGPGNVFLSGDSAGAGLACSLLQRRPDGVAGAVLLNPWLDVEMAHPAIEAMEHWDVMLRIDELRAWGAQWAGSLATSDPLVSPLHGRFSDLPPVHLITGGRDLLMPDSLDAYRMLQSAGNRGTLTYEPDGNHAVGLMGNATPESRRALKAIVSAFRA